MTACTVGTGWGSGWGGSVPWGGGPDSDLVLIGALAVRENVVRLRFNQVPLITLLLDPHDAANPERYAVTPKAGTSGYDGLPCRKVAPIVAAAAVFAGAGGLFIDVTVDRPFSPYPCKYIVAVNNLYTPDGFPLDPCFAMAEFYGSYRFLQPPNPDLLLPSRDIADPNTLSALLDPLPDVNFDQLGIIPIDDTGDYGTDEGLTNLKKRVYRRLVTRKGAFTFMPNYGVGVPYYGKKLNSAAVRESLAAEAEAQIALEPDVLKVRCSIVPDPNVPSQVRLRVLVRTVSGASGVKFDVPFSAVLGLASDGGVGRHHGLAHLAHRGGLVGARRGVLQDAQGKSLGSLAQLLIALLLAGLGGVVREPVVDLLSRHVGVMPQTGLRWDTQPRF